MRLSALAFTAAAAAQRMGATFATTMTQASAEGASLQKRLRCVTCPARLAAPSPPVLTRCAVAVHSLGASVVPLFAAISSSTAGATLPLITSAVASFIKLYLLLLFVRVLLTWFPNVDWMGQPWVTLRQVTDPYLNLFRNLIPPLMGQIDFTPIFGFLVLQFLVQVLGADDIYSV